MDDRIYLLRDFCKGVLFEVGGFFNDLKQTMINGDLDSFEITLELPGS